MNLLKSSAIFIFIIFLVILFIYGITLLINFPLQPKNYDIVLPYMKSAKDAIICPTGCVRGRCEKVNKTNDTTNKCIYDFQCNYCQDKDTSLMYVDFNNNRTLQPIYEEEGLSPIQKRTLNNEIEDNNKYIQELNKKIMLVNKNSESYNTKYLL